MNEYWIRETDTEKLKSTLNTTRFTLPAAAISAQAILYLLPQNVKAFVVFLQTI